MELLDGPQQKPWNRCHPVECVAMCVQCSTSKGLLWQHLGEHARVQHAPPRTKSHFLIQKSRHHLGRTKMKTSCYLLEPKFFIIAHVTLFVCKCHMASWKKSFGVDIQNCMGLVSKLLLFGLMSEPFVRFAISPPIRLRKILKAPPFVLFQNRDLKSKDTLHLKGKKLTWLAGKSLFTGYENSNKNGPIFQLFQPRLIPPVSASTNPPTTTGWPPIHGFSLGGSSHLVSI